MGKDTSSFDYFGVGIEWNYKGSDKQKTVAGTVMTLIFIGLTVYSIVTVSISLFRKQDPEVTKSIFFESDPAKVSISPEDFSFAVGLQDPYDYIHFVDETIYTMKGVYRTQNRSLDDDNELFLVSKQYDMQMVPCTLEHFGSNSHLFEGLALQNLFCPSLDLDIDIELEGVFESPTYSTIDLFVYPCVNSTESDIVCKSQEEINYWLEGAYFAIHFADQSIDPENHDQPEIYFRNSYFGMISTQMYKFFYFYIKHMSIETDTGVIYPVTDTDRMVGFDKAFETSSFTDFDMAVQFRMKVSSQIESYQRRYHKLTFVLAEITGLLETYIIIIVFIISPLQRFRFYQRFVADNFVVSDKWFQQNTKKQIKSEDIQYSEPNNPDKRSKGLLTPKASMGGKNPSTFKEATNLKEKDIVIQVKEQQKSSAQQPTEESQQPPNDHKRETETRVQTPSSIKSPRGPNHLHRASVHRLKSQERQLTSLGNYANWKQNRVKLLSQPSGDYEKTVELDSDRCDIREFGDFEQHQGDLEGGIQEQEVEDSVHHDEVVRFEEKQESDSGPELVKESQKASEIESSSPETKDAISNSNSIKETQNEVLKKLKEIEEEFHEHKKIHCRVSSWDFLKSVFGWSFAKNAKAKKMVFDVGYQNMEDVLDIKQYFTAKRELQLLKTILLNSQQIEVFERIINEKVDISTTVVDRKEKLLKKKGIKI